MSSEPLRHSRERMPIYLAHESARPRRVVRHLSAHGRHDGQPVPWLYLGRDYLRMRAWEESLGKGFERVKYARQLQDIGNRWRRPFLDWVAALGKVYGGLEWWSSRIAERNTYVSPLYRNICYLHIARLFGSPADSPLIIISDSRALLHEISLQSELKSRIRWIGRPLWLREWTVWMLRLLPVWTFYVIKALLELKDARKTRRGQPAFPMVSNKVRVLIHSCMDEECFREDGSTHDRYFTLLPEELRKRDYDVVIVPWLCNLRRSRREAFQWFQRHPNRYLIPEDYYTLADYIWAAWVVLKQAWLPRGKQVFEGNDVTVLVREASRWGAADTGIARFVRYFRLIQRLKTRGFRANVFIDKFENMVTEKPQVMAFRTYMPEVTTVGFQHYLASYPLQLHMFTTPEEAAYAPHPDVIVCNSPFSAELFAKEGFPAQKLRVGPSLRYLHLMNPRQQGRKAKNVVLVILPLDTVAAVEMMHKLLEGFPDDEGIRFLLKFHPMMLERQCLLTLTGRVLPVHMVRVQGEMAGWIGEATCAIVPPGTTSGLELLLAGVPTVIMGRETDFDMNPLAWFEGWGGPVHSSDELRNAVLRMLSPFNGDGDVVRAWVAQWRQRCLSPLCEETIRAFVEPVGYKNPGNSS